MANYNKVLLMGNLTRDPELSYLPTQTAVVDFGLAVNRRWTGKDGEKREQTCFVDCRAFGSMAENLNKYMNKGRPIFIEGRLDFDSWTAQDGSKRSKHRVTVQSFQFLNSSRGAGGTTGSAGERQTWSGSGNESQQKVSEDENRYEYPSGDDDVPF